jgi:ureidoglycolate lyase
MQTGETLPHLIVAQPLTHQNFAAFGDLIAPVAHDSTAINAGTAQRFDRLTELDVGAHGGAACLAIFRTQDDTQAAPCRLWAFERHCLGSQTFVPMGQSRCLAVVTSGERTPDESAIHAFIVEPGQGITVRRGVWHHPLITLGAADVLVIERRATEVDCEIARIAGQFIVTVTGM